MKARKRRQPVPPKAQNDVSERGAEQSGCVTQKAQRRRRENAEILNLAVDCILVASRIRSRPKLARRLKEFSGELAQAVEDPAELAKVVERISASEADQA